MTAPNGRPLPEQLLELLAPISTAMLPQKLDLEVPRPPVQRMRIVVRRAPPPPPAADREQARRLVVEALSRRSKPGRMPADLLEGLRLWGWHLACRHLPGMTRSEALAWMAAVMAAMRAGLARLPPLITAKLMGAFQTGIQGRRP